MDKITPFLWFDGNAEEAVNFYTSVFENAKIGTIHRWGDSGPAPKGSVLTAEFTLEGQKFVALNGGPQYKFTPAVSFYVSCKDQKEVDYFWDKLAAGDQEHRCGWLVDKFGVSWQIIPDSLMGMLMDKNPAKSRAVMQALLKMSKIDIQTLKDAHANAR